MSNQPQPRSRFRLGSMARPFQPPAPTPTPAPRTQMQLPVTPLPRGPRPTIGRPALRPPTATQPPPAQAPVPQPQAPRAPAPPPQAPRFPPAFQVPRTLAPTSSAPAFQRPRAPALTPSAPTPPLSSVIPTAVTSQTSATANVSPPSPPKQRSAPASPVTQKSPPTPKAYSDSTTIPSQLTSPSRTAPASPVIPKSPTPPRTSPISRTFPSPPTAPASTTVSPMVRNSSPPSKVSPVSRNFPSPSSVPSSPKPKNVSPSPSTLSSPALRQPVAHSMSTSPPKPKSPPPSSMRSLPSPPPKQNTPSPPKRPSSPPQYSSPSSKQVISSSIPMSPKPSNGLVATARSSLAAAARNLSAADSPRAAKPLPETPPQSPKLKASVASPPAFSLPPSLKSVGEQERRIPAVIEQKSVDYVRETVPKPGSFLNSSGNDSKPHIGMHVKPKERGHHKKPSVSEESRMRFITITGENTGAVMELGNSSRTHGNPHGSFLSSHHKLKSDGELSEDNLSHTTEGSHKKHDKAHNANAKNVPMRAFMNSNVQGVNSSIVFNSTFSHHDPGVHVSLTRKPYSGHGHDHGKQHKDQSNGKSIFEKK